jgi:hypothetical protein
LKSISDTVQQVFQAKIRKVMSSRRIKTIVIPLMIVGLLVMALVTYEWEVQWDLRSGDQRHVSFIFGLPGIPHSSEPTELAKWRAFDGNDREWIRVAAKPESNGILVNWCHTKIQNDLNTLSFYPMEVEVRAEFAKLLLHDLETGRDICEISRRCGRVTNALSSRSLTEIELPVTEEQVRRFWEESEDER